MIRDSPLCGVLKGRTSGVAAKRKKSRHETRAYENNE
jgi:hypothetical protein